MIEIGSMESALAVTQPKVNKQSQGDRVPRLMSPPGQIAETYRKPALSANKFIVSGASADAVYDTSVKRAFRVNHTAGKVLRLCDGMRSVKEIARIISEESRLEESQVLKDIQKFLLACPGDWWQTDNAETRHGSGELFLENLEQHPRRVSWESTHGCNLQCVHCIVDAGARSERELDTDEATTMITQMADVGVRNLTITGGEPTLRKDFFKLVRLASRTGMSLTILTNGTTIDPKHARALRDAEAGVQITILGSTPQIHDAITRVPGSLARSIRGIKVLQKARVRLLDASFVIMRNNFDDLHKTRELLAGLGVGVNAGLLLPVGRAKANWDRIGLPPRTLKKLRIEESVRTDAVLQGFLDAPRFGTVPCPTDSMAVDSEGHFIPCSGIRGITLGDVRGSVSEIWEAVSSRARFMKSISVESVETCGGCELRYSCTGGCRAVTHAYAGDLRAKNPFCEVY